MKKTFSHLLLRKIFAGVAAGLMTLCLAGLVYLYIVYSDLLIGQVSMEPSAAILTKLDGEKFDRILKRLEKRKSLPYPPENLPNPFSQP